LHNGLGVQADAVFQTRSPRLTPEHSMNYVLSTFTGEKAMLKAVIQEAAALASLSLFVGMIAIWSQVLGNF
jgi:hypothetical protein